MRLFIAFDTPEEAQEHLKGLQQELKPSVKASFPKQFHLTLQFIGERETPQEVKAQLSKLNFPRIKCALKGIGQFPEKGRPRVVWAGVKPKEELEKLHKQIRELVGGESRFHPHITLARVKKVENREELQSFMKKDVKPLSWEVREVKLIRSTLTREGPEYETLLTVELK